MFSSPQLKDPIILDPGKKVTQYLSILFSHGLKKISFISQVIGRVGKFKYVTYYFLCYTIFDVKHFYYLQELSDF